MSTKWFTLGLFAFASLATTAQAAPEEHGHGRVVTPRPAAAPRGKDAGARYVGAHVVAHPERPVHATTNPPHEVVIHNAHTNKDERHAIIIDHRPAHVIDHDPRLRVTRRGYRPLHNWEHYHRANGGWWHVWGITSWDAVGTVTCEAANEATGEMYPVSQDRDERAWDDGSVNTILDQALDDCMAEAGSNQCTAATPSCTFQSY